ncbi:GH25 family lysozyme [Convivina intestini]|uniref:GH25 family lysozyme n=1 Tax=Convivina intestini TaxID=1505726 RepID=UPI00200FA3FB|nr:GH25 family lysozyme [Convivina intestini]
MTAMTSTIILGSDAAVQADEIEDKLTGNRAVLPAEGTTNTLDDVNLMQLHQLIMELNHFYEIQRIAGQGDQPDSSKKAAVLEIASNYEKPSEPQLEYLQTKSEVVSPDVTTTDNLRRANLKSKARVKKQQSSQDLTLIKSQASLSVSQSASQQQSQLDSISQSQADVKWASQKSSESTSLSAADQQKHQQESQAAVNDYRSSVSASLADIKNHRSTPAIDVVDISSHNGHLSVQDFTRMKEQGVKAVIVKLTESTNYQNPYAQEQIQNAQAAGLAVGAYHYSHYNSGQLAHNEASYFADAADKYGLNKDTLMINDLEENDTKSSTVTADATNFNQTLKDRGYNNTAIYLNPTYQKETGINLSFVGNDRVWMAQYPYYPSSSDLRHGENGMWQWTSSATFAGVTGQFDGSILYNPSLFNGSGISTTGGNLHKAVITSIEKFQEAGNHYVLEGTMTVNEVQNVNGLQQVRISELTADPFDWTDNGIPTVLLENTNGSNSFKVGDQVKFKAQYQRGNISKYDTASNAIGIDYPQGVGIVWFDANKAWNHA